MLIEVLEPVLISDIYADDIASVEILGPNVRMTYFTWQAGERIVVCKLVRPHESVRGDARALVDKALKALSGDRLRLN